MEEHKLEIKFTITFKSMDDELVDTLENNIHDDVLEKMLCYEEEGHLEQFNVDKEVKFHTRECYSCRGKGVGLDWGAMNFWECDTCDGTGEIEID
ncbi:gp139 [Bacillus phage W.Ph.]|uniref:Gp139 n=1 Tax=Bacillus phage W.Ph. TaxID=764595 RepID=G9B1P0_9CAUD|nr:gp139 [Bacillus phage W.Ph.]ADH03285.1 gp139 [Bacillus phage W.Ph.]